MQGSRSKAIEIASATFMRSVIGLIPSILIIHFPPLPQPTPRLPTLGHLTCVAGIERQARMSRESNAGSHKNQRAVSRLNFNKKSGYCFLGISRLPRCVHSHTASTFSSTERMEACTVHIFENKPFQSNTYTH